MDTVSKKHINLEKLKKVWLILDGFFIKFFLVFIMIVVTFSFIYRVFLDAEKASKIALYLVITNAILISMLWTSLSSKIEFSIFNNYINSSIKKKLLTSRGFWIFVYIMILNNVKSKTSFSTGFELMFNYATKVFLSMGLVVIIGSSILIVLKRVHRVR